MIDLATPPAAVISRQPRSGREGAAYLLQEGLEKVVVKDMVLGFTDAEVVERVQQIPEVFKINMGAADAEQLCDPEILLFFEGKSLKIERYILYMVHSHFINGYAKSTRDQWLTAVGRFARKCQATGRSMVAHPFTDVCSLIKDIMDDLFEQGAKSPRHQLSHFRQAIGKLTMVQLGVPPGCRIPSLAEGSPRSEWKNVYNHVNEVTLKQRSSSESIPVKERASRHTITEAEAKEVFLAMLTSRQPDLQIPLRGYLTLHLLLSLGCRGQDLAHIKFSGFTLSRAEYSNSAEGFITLFNMLSARARKMHQDGQTNSQAVIQAADPMLDPVGALGIYLASWNFHFGLTKGLNIGQLIQAGDALWIGLKMLADRTSPLSVTPSQLQRSLRAFIDYTTKHAATRLGRNSLSVKLSSQGVQELQIAQLQGWDVGSVMQRHYLSKDPQSSLPAMLQASGFSPSTQYHVPRSSVYPQLICPRVWKLLFPNEGAMALLKTRLDALQLELKKNKSMELQRETDEVDAALEYPPLVNQQLVVLENR
jgi:hypothetical protein